MVALDGQIDARAIDQVGDQDIFKHVQILFTRVETDDHQFRDVRRKSDRSRFVFLNGRFGG